eukprot:4554276-Pyramimonas_sp.AAC.1
MLPEALSFDPEHTQGALQGSRRDQVDGSPPAPVASKAVGLSSQGRRSLPIPWETVVLSPAIPLA